MTEIESRPYMAQEFYRGIHRADKDYKYAIVRTVQDTVTYKVIELDGLPADDHRLDGGEEDIAVTAVRLHIIASIERSAREYFIEKSKEVGGE